MHAAGRVHHFSGLNGSAPLTTTPAAAQAVKKEVDAAVEQAKKGTIPSVDVLYKNIYRAPLGCVARGIDAKSIHKVG